MVHAWGLGFMVRGSWLMVEGLGRFFTDAKTGLYLLALRSSSSLLLSSLELRDTKVYQP